VWYNIVDLISTGTILGVSMSKAMDESSGEIDKLCFFWWL
jgi:hypothetical protein